MVTAMLPDDGELRLGYVLLPAGRRALAEQGSGEPVAWVTRQPVPGAGRTWSALSAMHHQTGLVPVLLGDDPGEDSEGLIFNGFACTPADVTELNNLGAVQVLQGMWKDALPEDDAEGDGPHLVQARAPFSREFPGLAPAQNTRLSANRLDAALGSLEPARIGLVPANRPADVLPRVGWLGADGWTSTLPIAAILRSWEARFGAKLLMIGPGTAIRLLAERPPSDFGAAQRLAAEHFVFCDECAGRGLRDIHSIATNLADTPVWTFWWD